MKYRYLTATALFLAVAFPVFNATNFHPFMPHGFPRSGAAGHEVGVMAAAAIIFFAFYGFDAIATAAGPPTLPPSTPRRTMPPVAEPALRTVGAGAGERRALEGLPSDARTKGERALRAADAIQRDPQLFDEERHVRAGAPRVPCSRHSRRRA